LPPAREVTQNPAKEYRVQVDVLKFVHERTVRHRIECLEVEKHCPHISSTLQEIQPVVGSFQQCSCGRFALLKPKLGLIDGFR